MEGSARGSGGIVDVPNILVFLECNTRENESLANGIAHGIVPPEILNDWDTTQHRQKRLRLSAESDARQPLQLALPPAGPMERVVAMPCPVERGSND